MTVHLRYSLLGVAAALVMTSSGISCKSGNTARGSSIPTIADTDGAPAVPRQTPVQYTYTVKNVYPHNTFSYTQGLYWHDGYLWESTGQYGESAFMQVELASGKAVKEIKLDNKYFGEGATLHGNSIYQLTWLEKTCFVYDAATLELTGQHSYDGQGWGITSDGRKLYMSNGSSEIQVIDPDGFRRESVINVTMGNRRVYQLNELEWIEGRIWANIYGSESIVIIDPATGKVTGVVDLHGILPENERTPKTDVMNGIAYDPATGRIFVTGKCWSRLYEIEIKEK